MSPCEDAVFDTILPQAVIIVTYHANIRVALTLNFHYYSQNCNYDITAPKIGIL